MIVQRFVVTVGTERGVTPETIKEALKNILTLLGYRGTIKVEEMAREDSINVVKDGKVEEIK